jgi:hypothetical protein
VSVRWCIAAVTVALTLPMAGCGNKKTETPAATVKPKEAPAGGGKPSALPSDGGEKIIWQRPDRMPDWANARASLAAKDVLRIVGIGLSNAQEQKASDDATQQAGAAGASYLLGLVDAKKFVSDKLMGSSAHDPVQTLVRDTVGQNLTAAILRSNSGTGQFTQHYCRTEFGVLVYYYRVYRLFELPAKSVADALETSRERIGQEQKRERDETRKELLKGFEEMLKAVQKSVLGADVPAKEPK